MKERHLFFGSLSLLLTQLVSSRYVLDFIPVLDLATVDAPKDNKGIFLEVKEPSFSDGVAFPPPATCPDSPFPYPYGRGGTFVNTKGDDPGWLFRLSAPPGYFMKGNMAPTSFLLKIRFGDETSCMGDPEANSDVHLDKHPGGEFEIDESEYINNSNCGLIKILVDVSVDTECMVILDNDIHELIFRVPDWLAGGDYDFKPCFAILEVEGPTTLEFQKVPSSRRLLAEDTTCPYCTKLPCPCCPSSLPPVSGIAIAGVTLAAITTALTFAIFLFLILTHKAQRGNGNAAQRTGNENQDILETHASNTTTNEATEVFHSTRSSAEDRQQVP